MKKDQLSPEAYERQLAASRAWRKRNYKPSTRVPDNQYIRLERVSAIKLAAGCVDCGYKDHPEALDFDHLPEFIKSANISNLIHRGPWSAIEAEISKCEVRCANCHRVMTARRRAAVLGR